MKTRTLGNWAQKKPDQRQRLKKRNIKAPKMAMWPLIWREVCLLLKKRNRVILPNGSSEMYFNMRTKYNSYIQMITPSEFGEWGMGKGDYCQKNFNE